MTDERCGWKSSELGKFTTGGHDWGRVRLGRAWLRKATDGKAARKERLEKGTNGKDHEREG